MRSSRASRTAEQMALSRAIETRKGPEERICFDPFAERFLGRTYRALLWTRLLRDGVERLIESLFPGHHDYVVARTRFFDDFLEEQLARAPQQLVILGAGYDSRAHRFADRLGAVRTFEVDHPATSAAKRSTVGSLPAANDRVTYVPVEFNTERLSDRLRQSGYQDQHRTVFLWEGVTPYLSAEAVDEVLRFVRSSASRGSVVLFDYILDSVLDGTCEMRGARNERDRMGRSPEPFTFGIPMGASSSFLAERGFHEVADVGGVELEKRYFRGSRQRYVKPWWRMVHATVA